VFDFKQQHAVGASGEKLFLLNYQGSTQGDGRKVDLVFEGETVELKTDSYSMDDTANFFMERYSDVDTLKEGGPWRAVDCDWFVYLFINQKTFFWFRPKELCAFLDEYTKDKKPKMIPNKGWTTVGFTVPRKLCEPFCARQDTFK